MGRALSSRSEGQALHRRRPAAWIEHRENGWLVRWRDQGKGRSKKFRNEDDAVRFKQTVEEVRLPGTDVRIDEQGYFWAPIRRHEAGDREYSVEEYARAMVEANQDLADTTRALYRRIIRSTRRRSRSPASAT